MALPPTIQTIVGLVGHSAAMALVHELGGNDFRFPAAQAGANWEFLVEVIGTRRAKSLIGNFKGDEVYIALCADALRGDRNRNIIGRYDALLLAGHSSRGAVSILVREYRLSNRQIETIVNGPAPSMAPEIAMQGSLF